MVHVAAAWGLDELAGVVLAEAAPCDAAAETNVLELLLLIFPVEVEEVVEAKVKAFAFVVVVMALVEKMAVPAAVEDGNGAELEDTFAVIFPPPASINFFDLCICCCPRFSS